MNRYEIISNVATSDQSLRDHPELIDLAQSLEVKDIETRFVKLVVREEEQINVASAKTAKGVTLRETAIKTLQPQASLKGCLNWVKSVAGHSNRGIHLEIEKIRASNGAGLVLAQVLPRGNKVFASGLGDGNWQRLVARPDITLKNIPSEFQKHADLKNEYRQRGTRTSFFEALKQMSEMFFLPEQFRKKALDISKSRNANRLTELTDAEVINVGLIQDILDRYQKLLDDFFLMVKTGQLGGDLPQVFGLLTQGISFEELKDVLLPFTIESKRSRIDNKRLLINEVRICISKSKPELLSQLNLRFTPLIIKARIAQDPIVYRKLVPLQVADAEETEALEVARQLYKPIFILLEHIDLSKVDPAQLIPNELKQSLFELVVSLTYQGEYTVLRRGGTVSKKANLARKVLERISFNKLNLSSLHSLNPKLPMKGVAQNLTGKVPVTTGELAKISENLNRVLFPLAQLADEISSVMSAKHQEQESKRSSEALRSYLHGAYPMLRNTKYMVGFAGLTPAMRGGALSAGRGLGLTMLASLEEIRNREIRERLSKNPRATVGSFTTLMGNEQKKFFPLKAKLEMISRAYRFLYGERIAALVRRFVVNRINLLFDIHGDRLFETIYQFLVWDNQLTLSRYQAGMILYRQGVFEPPRLKEFGFKAGAMANGHERDNPWLHTKEDSDGQEPRQFPLSAEGIEKEYRAKLEVFEGLRQKCQELAKVNGDGETKTLAGIIAEKAEDQVFDLHDPVFRESLAASDAAKALWAEIEAVVQANAEAIQLPKDEGEVMHLVFNGATAYLSLLKESHSFSLGDRECVFRIKPAWDLPTENLKGNSALVLNGLNQRLMGNGGSENIKTIKPALELLQSHCKAWGSFREMATIALIDQMLRETILTLIRPAPPAATELKNFKPGTVMCLGMSASDQTKFNKLVRRIDIKDVYLTLSQLSSWLATFERLGKEMEELRDIIADIQRIIAGLNISLFDAPYIMRYGSLLKTLDELLSIPPEDFNAEDQTLVKSTAMEIEGVIREYFEKERSFAPKNRYFNRITTQLKSLRSGTDLNFVSQLHEGGVLPASSGEGEENKPAVKQTRGTGQFQTFSSRLREVIANRKRVTAKSVFVLSPGGAQKELTINLIDQVLKLNGLFTPILADISSGEAFIDDLRTRLPPHRLFNLNEI
ncbi:MAG: hypothetical protein O6934_04070 [SAR324 cluster bacterium]|nr:hypothetical protein [SAR324 cluster bacterium]